MLVLSRGRDIHSQDLSSGLQPAWLVKLLLSACHLLLHVLPQSTRLRNGIRVFTIGCIDVHKMRVLRASAPAEVLDLHDLQGITACQSSSGFCDRQERPIQYVQANGLTEIACFIECSSHSQERACCQWSWYERKRNTQQGAMESRLGNAVLSPGEVP